MIIIPLSIVIVIVITVSIAVVSVWLLGEQRGRVLLHASTTGRALLEERDEVGELIEIYGRCH